MRFLYTLALWMLIPYILLRLLWRGRIQPEYLHHIGERFGFYTQHCDKPVIWLHAVSVGETRATHNLVSRLRAIYPKHQILLTHTTPTGRATSEQLYGENVTRAYLPYDYPFAVKRFLRHFRPQLGILMETEIWFNLIHKCQQSHMPLLLLNARMSEKSAQGYARFTRLTRAALKQLNGIAAQTKDDAARLIHLGANNVSVMGNLKFDIEPPATMLTLGQQLREQFGTARKILLAASTREGEEQLLLTALKHALIPDLLLVIVPRHPQRFNEVAALLEQHGMTYQRRSANSAVPNEIQAVLGDSMGEMFAYYTAADLAFIGGSLLPYGGQNLIEASAVDTPVIIGPHTYNFAEATQLAVATGAAIQVPDAAHLISNAQRLLTDAVSLSAMRSQCAAFIQPNRGATNKALAVIAPLLPHNN